MFWPKNKVRLLSFDWHCVLKVDKGWPIEWPMAIWSKCLYPNKNNEKSFLFYFFNKLNKYFQINSNPATSFGSSYWFLFLVNQIILSPEKKTYFIENLKKWHSIRKRMNPYWSKSFEFNISILFKNRTIRNSTQMWYHRFQKTQNPCI